MFYQVRITAAMSLAKVCWFGSCILSLTWIIQDTGLIGWQKLHQFFKSCWFDKDTDRLLANDFSDLAEYNLKKGVIAAIAST